VAAPALTDLSGAIDAVEDASRAARERLELTREQVLDRAVATRDELRDRLDTIDLEPVTTRAQIGLWSGLQVLGASLAALPGFLTRLLRALSAAGDVLADRGEQLTERSREVVTSIQPSRRQVRRMRLRTAGSVGIGLLVGVAVGWFLGRRRREEVVIEETVTAHLDLPPATPSAAPVTPVAPDPGASFAGHDPGDRA
jgi:hypothetical protein